MRSEGRRIKSNAVNGKNLGPYLKNKLKWTGGCGSTILRLAWVTQQDSAS
jgi:hypothetical protein